MRILGKILEGLNELAARVIDFLFEGGRRAKGRVFSEQARTALHRLGLAESQVQTLAEGKSVAFNLSGAAEGTITIARLLPNGRLQVGIYTIKDVGGGLKDFLTFEARTKAAAKAIGAMEVELLAIEIVNEDLTAVLVRGGFTPTKIPVPEELGGGVFHAISRVEEVN